MAKPAFFAPAPCAGRRQTAVFRAFALRKFFLRARAGISARVLRCRKPFYFPVGALFFDFSACLLSANRFPLPDCAGRADICAQILSKSARQASMKSRAPAPDGSIIAAGKARFAFHKIFCRAEQFAGGIANFFKPRAARGKRRRKCAISDGARGIKFRPQLDISSAAGWSAGADARAGCPMKGKYALRGHFIFRSESFSRRGQNAFADSIVLRRAIRAAAFRAVLSGVVKIEWENLGEFSVLKKIN